MLPDFEKYMHDLGILAFLIGSSECDIIIQSLFVFNSFVFINTIVFMNLLFYNILQIGIVRNVSNSIIQMVECVLTIDKDMLK